MRRGEGGRAARPDRFTRPGARDGVAEQKEREYPGQRQELRRLQEDTPGSRGPTGCRRTCRARMPRPFPRAVASLPYLEVVVGNAARRGSREAMTV